MVEKKKKDKPVKWVLKAHDPDSGEWEEIEVFDKEKSYSDLKDRIEDLKEQGYDMVRLDAYDAEDNFVKRVFVKKLSTNRNKPTKQLQQTVMEFSETVVKMLTNLTSTISTAYTQMLEMMSKVQQQRGDYSTFLQEMLAYEIAKHQFLEMLGIKPGEQSSQQNPMTQLAQQFIIPFFQYALATAAPDLYKMISTNIEKLARPTTPVATTPTTSTVPPITEKVSSLEEAKNIAREIIESAKKSAAEAMEKADLIATVAMLPPCAKGEKCVEIETEGGEQNV